MLTATMKSWALLLGDQKCGAAAVTGILILSTTCISAPQRASQLRRSPRMTVGSRCLCPYPYLTGHSIINAVLCVEAWLYDAITQPQPFSANRSSHHDLDWTLSSHSPCSSRLRIRLDKASWGWGWALVGQGSYAVGRPSL